MIASSPITQLVIGGARLFRKRNFSVDVSAPGRVMKAEKSCALN